MISTIHKKSFSLGQENKFLSWLSSSCLESIFFPYEAGKRRVSSLIYDLLLIILAFFFPLDKQAEERLQMVEERRTLTEQKMSLEREIKKQEKAAQDLILNKNRNNRQKLAFGFKPKGAL